MLGPNIKDVTAMLKIEELAKGLFDRVGNTGPTCQSMLADIQKQNHCDKTSAN